MQPAESFSRRWFMAAGRVDTTNRLLTKGDFHVR